MTLDADGAAILQRAQSPQWIAAKPTACVDTTGAGDTFISALTLALAGNTSVAIATELALSAAAVVVAKKGTATCSIAELETFMATAIKPDGFHHPSSLQSVAGDRSIKEVA